MYNMADAHLAEQAKTLLSLTLSNYDEKYGLGTMSCAAYDTAWVALVTKVVDGNKQWLFPQCFEYLLATQSQDGSWGFNSIAQIDGIVNTAAALLALKRYSAEPLQFPIHDEDIASRVERATTSLRSQLNDWDVSATNHVGFEIIVPAILHLLEAQDSSLGFDFQAKSALLKTHDAKMSRFQPEALYGTKRLTALHSLEAFIGKIDFDKVKHHAVLGSMMGSPSSTAAYLMNASQWDDESEAYLHHVVEFAAGQGSGGVPSAFPSTHFECTWILSTLLRAGFTADEIESSSLTKVKDILSMSFAKEGGVLGFAPSFEADVDDTAKTIICLNALGEPATPARLIETFENGTHFRTYAGERDPSCTANCNALLALLTAPDVAQHSEQILKITTFLCDLWWTSDRRIEDKWNASYLYSSVLLVEALTDILQLIEQNRLPGVFDVAIQSKIAVALFQAAFRPLLDQESDGSWGHSLEETAYGVLILSEVRRVVFFERIQKPLDEAIAKGVAFLNAPRLRSLNYIWIEKVSYASPLLTDAYVLAALKAASSPVGAPVGRSLWPEGYMTHLDKYVKNFHETPLFREHPYWFMEGSMIESALFLPLLRAQRLVVFPFDDAEDIKYFDMLPMFWTCTNNRKRTYAPTTFLYELALLSLLVFQIDEFMEDVAASLFVGNFDKLRDLINSLFDRTKKGNEQIANGEAAAESTSVKAKAVKEEELSDVKIRSKLLGGAEKVTYEEVTFYLKKFISYLEDHPAVRNASPADKDMLDRELRIALLAHAQQAEDSSRYNAETRPDGKVLKPTSADTFFTWVRTTSAEHDGSTYAFYFVSCILGASHQPKGVIADCFTSGQEKYFANAVMRHMATMCRMYNDLASAERDNAEGSLNCVDFPEFDQEEPLAVRKAAVFDVLNFETEAFEAAFARLRRATHETWAKKGDKQGAALAQRRLDIIEFFADQMDLYGQVWCNADRSRPLPGVHVAA